MRRQRKKLTSSSIHTQVSGAKCACDMARLWRVRVPSDSCVIDGEQDQSAAKERKVLQKLETTEDSAVQCSTVNAGNTAAAERLVRFATNLYELSEFRYCVAGNFSQGKIT
jgi:hypothetical protein